ncbi:hypothetical protein SPPR111872_19095 [Sphingobacterium prati]
MVGLYYYAAKTAKTIKVSSSLYKIILHLLYNLYYIYLKIPLT